ncbi:MAG: hypothetical protein QM704_02935 [Anaeromyxobacteraceae bacterium]
MPSTSTSLRRAALLVVVASLAGPAVVFLDAALHGPSTWASAAAFVAGHRPLQALPPLLGFPLLLGFVLFVSAARRLDAERGHRVDQGPVFLLTAIYGALVAVNYVSNGMWAHQAGSEELGAVAAFSMNNPRALTWSFELAGYGLLGAVTWLVAPTFREEPWIAWLLRANGVVSVGSAAWAAVDQTWVLAPAGLVFYAAWNLLVVVLMALVARRFREA